MTLSVVAFAIVVGFSGFVFADDNAANQDVVLPGLEQMIEDGTFDFEDPTKVFQEYQVLTIDTTNQRVCNNIRETLFENGSISPEDNAHLCDFNEEQPFVSVMVPSERNEFTIRFSELNEQEQALAIQTRNYIPLAIGMMAVLHALPESATGWEPFEWDGVTDRWIDNVNNGPERDPDSGFFNYFAHPYVGAGYYQVARHEGFSPIASFAYSAFMSTVIWEFGIEAVSAVPSTQDLIITPVVGSLLGELFFHWHQRIEENGGQVLGSTQLGSFTQFALHPAGELLDFTNNLFAEDIFEETESYFYVDRDSSDNTRLNFGVRFWFKK